MEGSGGEQQQVYVTGADGEQMVLSGPEAAALLEQAGINIHDGTQVSSTVILMFIFILPLKQ